MSCRTWVAAMLLQGSCGGGSGSGGEGEESTGAAPSTAGSLEARLGYA